MFKKLCFFFFFFSTFSFTYAHENLVKIKKNNKITCIYSNGVPQHQIGKFPNRANPNKFILQKLTFCFPTTPILTKKITRGLTTVGVTNYGIPIRPYTAEYFDANSQKRYSKNSSSGWRKQAMFNPRSLGIDKYNGHVDKSGLYHYHKISKNLNFLNKNSIIGYAPDGFKILYKGEEISSSWKLKTGVRPSPPGGLYDGEFEEDFEYVSGSGSLDECNGKILDGVYNYFITDKYPFFPRCFKGIVKLNFMERN